MSCVLYSLWLHLVYLQVLQDAQEDRDGSTLTHLNVTNQMLICSKNLYKCSFTFVGLLAWFCSHVIAVAGVVRKNSHTHLFLKCAPSLLTLRD